MSFTFRDLFSDDDEPDPSGSGPGDSNPSAPPGERREASPASGGQEQGRPASKHVSFQLSELLPFVPPAISARSGIPMEKEVRIPLPEDGSRDVSLSTLHRVCPELFAAEITPLNDSVITLPARIGASLAASREKEASSPFSAPSAAREARSDEKVVVEKTKQDSEERGENPFWTMAQDEAPQAVGKKNSSFGAELSSLGDSLGGEASSKGGQVIGWQTSSKKGSQDAAPSSGFQSPSSPASGFSQPGDPQPAAPQPAAPQPAAPQPAAPQSEREDEIVEGDTGLPEQGGASFGSGGEKKSDPEAPETDVSSGFAGGMEDSSEPFSKNPFDSSEGFASLFSKQVKDDADIPYPEQQPEEKEKPEPSESYSGGWNAPEPPVPPREDERGETERPAPLPESAPSSGGEGLEHADETSPAESAPSSEAISPDQGAKPTPAEADSTASSHGFRSLGAKRSESPTPAVVSKEEASPASRPPARDDDWERNLEFRAIFSSSESFTLSRLASRVVDLEGILGCALATPTGVVQEPADGESQFGDEAREMVDSIRNVARLTGVPGAKSFTLHTDQGTISLFLEGDCCVTVNHEPGEFGPGVREKLILISRCLHKLD